MPDQPTPEITSDDVERVLRREFAKNDREEAWSILLEYGSEEWHRESDRVRVAALKLAGGTIAGLRAAIETANADYRDVLAPAEYPEYLRTVGPSASVTPEERQRIINADWAQYSEWLYR